MARGLRGNPEDVGFESETFGASERKVSDKRKQSLYFPAEVVDELKEEAARLDRSMSWVVQTAWRLAKDQIAAMQSVGGSPSANDGAGGVDGDDVG